MKSYLSIFRGLLIVSLSVLFVVALACGSADDDASDEAAPAAAAAAPATEAKKETAPAAEAAKKAVQDPSKGVKVAKQEIGKGTSTKKEAAMAAAEEDYKYVANAQVPGVYWDYIYTGPRPTKFGENPKFAAMVKAGKLPPVEDRLPKDFKVNQPPHGIGVYGGTWRITSTGSGPSNRMYWHKKNSDEFVKVPHVGFHEVSEDGLVYTFMNSIIFYNSCH